MPEMDPELIGPVLDSELLEYIRGLEPNGKGGWAVAPGKHRYLGISFDNRPVWVIVKAEVPDPVPDPPPIPDPPPDTFPIEPGELEELLQADLNTQQNIFVGPEGNVRVFLAVIADGVHQARVVQLHR